VALEFPNRFYGIIATETSLPEELSEEQGTKGGEKI